MFRETLSKVWKIYFEHYRKFMIIPVILLLITGGSLVYNKFSTGEFISKDVTLKGGYQARISTNESLDFSVLGLTDLDVKVIRSPISSALRGYDLVTANELNTNDLGQALGVDPSVISVAYKSSNIAASFYNQAMLILALSFILMGAVVFYYFRELPPSVSIITSTLLDVIGLLGFMNLMGIQLSTASIGALLMIIGYSTDSDILLSTNIIKRTDGTLSERMLRALRTELTIDISAISVFAIMFLLSNNAIIKSISIILLFGVFFDVINTWLGTAGIQRIILGRRQK